MALVPFARTTQATCFEHYTSPMVYPITGRTISSYKKLMNDPATVEVWQTTFGKDFNGMAQGCNKTGQKGTNAMFVMTKAEIASALVAGTKNHLRKSGSRSPPTKGKPKQNPNHGWGEPHPM